MFTSRIVLPFKDYLTVLTMVYLFWYQASRTLKPKLVANKRLIVVKENLSDEDNTCGTNSVIELLNAKSPPKLAHLPDTAGSSSLHLVEEVGSPLPIALEI